MLILDKSRALDLMVAHAGELVVPEPFAAASRVPLGAGFRVAIYAPLGAPPDAPPLPVAAGEAASVDAAVPAAREGSPARPVRAPLMAAGLAG